MSDDDEVADGAEEICDLCGVGIYFDSGLAEWQHEELVDCIDPTPSRG